MLGTSEIQVSSPESKVPNKKNLYFAKWLVAQYQGPIISLKTREHLQNTCSIPLAKNHQLYTATVLQLELEDVCNASTFPGTNAK